jgi:hypothetical protein
MGQESRRIAEARFSQEAILRDYLDLYRKLGVFDQEDTDSLPQSIAC